MNVRDFLGACDNKIVLDKSYRLPISIHKEADNLVKRLQTRQEKLGQALKKLKYSLVSISWMWT